MHSIESRFVIGPSNILFAGVYVPGNCTGCGGEGVKMALFAAHLNAEVILVVVAIGIYIISLSPHLHTPFPPSLISLMVSVDVKHHVYLLTMRIKVPGEIRRSRDLRGGRWSWTFKLAQKRSWVGRWGWAEKVGLLSLRAVQVVRQQQCNGHVFVTLPKHSSWNSNCAVHKSLGNGEGTPP